MRNMIKKINLMSMKIVPTGIKIKTIMRGRPLITIKGKEEIGF